MELFPHKSGLGLMEPVALPGHRVCVKYGEVDYYRKITWYESIPFFQCLNLGAHLAGASTANATEAVNLRLFDHEFGQFRWFPIDHVQVRMWLPSGEGKSRLRNLMVPLDEAIVIRDPCLHMTEFYVWEDKAPFFVAVNITDYDLAQVRLVAGGYRFKVTTKELPGDEVQAIKAGDLPCTTIMATGRA